MKKFLAFLLAAIMLCTVISVSAAEEFKPNSLPGQHEYSILATLTPPAIDGTVNDGEYGDAIVTYNYNDGLTRNGEVGNLSQEEMADFVASDWTLYMTYDNEYVYFACTYVDTDFDTKAGSAGYGIWDGDSLEIDFLKYTEDWEEYDIYDKSRVIIGMSKDGDYWAGWANTGVPSYIPSPPHYPKGELNGEKDCYVVTRDGDNFTYELKLTWEEVVGSDRPVDHIYFYVQLATDSVEYNDRVGHGAQFWWRNVVPFTEDEVDAIEEAINDELDVQYAFPILHFDGREILPELPETTAPETTEEPTTEEPTTEVPTTEVPTTEELTTEAPKVEATTAPVTEEPEAEATTKAPETEAPTTEAKTEASKNDAAANTSGCGSTVGVAGIALVAALGTCTVFVSKKNRDE